MTDAATGKIVTATAFRGYPTLVYFGFTRCPDVCPLTMQNAAELAQHLGPDARKFRVVFITIDLAYDTDARIRAFVSKFGSEPTFTGLRGTPAQLKVVAARYGVYYKAPTEPNSPDPESKIEHGATAYLFGPNGKAVAVLTALPSPQPQISQDAVLIRRLIAAK